MLKHILCSLLLLGAVTVQAQTKKTTPAKKAAPKASTSAIPAPALKNQTDSLSYAMGVSAGEFLKSQGVEQINTALLNKAIEDALKGTPGLFDMAEANAVIQRAAMSSAQRKSVAEKEKAKQFLEQNKKRAGITETASGLQYEVLVPGQGPKPTMQDEVLVHYAGKLLSGKEFDSSYARGEPVTLQVGSVIKGWTEALQLMPTGSKWRLFIPADLAYGDMGAGRDIPGGATLIFEVELLEIVK